MISLCQRCADKISDAYRLDPVKNGNNCFLCNSQDAVLYNFVPKRMLQRKPQKASAGIGADREAYMNRRRWA